MAIFDALVEFMRTVLSYCFELTQSLGMPSYGLAIIIMTLGIKLLLTPLTVKQIKSMRAMQKLQPRMKELQQKYKGNNQKLQEEMAKLYKELNVNPLSGCLPLIAQMPFLISIFYALQNFPYISPYESFLWLPSLGEPDPTYAWPVVSALTTFLVSRQTSPGGDDKAQMQAKVMQVFMPLFIGYISLTFPSGLVIYWTVSNIFQWVQQTWIYKMEEKEAA